MNISRVTTSIYRFFTKPTSAGIACGVQVNTIRCNGRPRSRLHTPQGFTGQLDNVFKSCKHTPLSATGSSLDVYLAFYWFIVIAVIF